MTSFIREALYKPIYRRICAMPGCGNAFQTDQPKRKYCDDLECSAEAARKIKEQQTEKVPERTYPIWDEKISKALLAHKITNPLLVMKLIRTCK